ncbi:methyl-accepting chemotaxis protein [uncultured Ramlibacter sp.]|uniref:methyl-accepting chemotaxis protein n=1 Tax=uncultured Ramlibacter sp. TaxID=260755 RepID=UPI002615B4E3|nr:methyl-accepting chemotaxis protein [uncultured Ramlibacter sp.]
MRRLSLNAKLACLALCVLAPLCAAAWLAPTPALRLGAGACIALVLYLLAALASSLRADMGAALERMQRIEQGDLAAAAAGTGRDELAALSQMMERMAGRMSAIVADVRTNSALVEQAGSRLARGFVDLQGRTERQASSLEQTSASVTQLAGTVQQNAQTAGQADARAVHVRSAAEEGQRSMAAAVETIAAVQADTQRMRDIVGIIDGVAFQTNILALNAAVEAARAGAQGRGFAVVASEVRRLAQRCSDEARKIRELIEGSNTQVEDSVLRIRAAGGGMQGIVDGVRGVADSMSQISRASGEQSTGLSQISATVHDLDEITRHNATLVEESANQAVYLKERAGTLSGAVAHFRLAQGTAGEAIGLVERAQSLFASGLGREAFLRQLTAQAGGFFDRDMYVFALDSQGSYLGFGGNPAKLGTRVQDIPGVDGDALLAAIVRQADLEPGWAEYDITNPVTRAVQTKMSYVLKLGELYVGCGVYKSVALAKAA